MSQKMPEYIRKQLPIPGLEVMSKAATEAESKKLTLQEKVEELHKRVFSLEVEVSLLQILLEKGG